jgi:hypothetical protein
MYTIKHYLVIRIIVRIIYVYFGEVLGKHSDVHGKIKSSEIRLITDNQEFIQTAKKLGINLNSGYNPFDYYTCEMCGNVKDVITDKCEECDE